MTTRRRLLAIVILGAWTFNIGMRAQTPSPRDARQEPTPTFRSGVKLIDIDVYITDKDGHFVKDLTRNDFEILEDGKPQDLQTFTFIDLPISSSSTAVAASASEPDVVTNEGTQGRLYVIVMDSPSTWAAPPTVGSATYSVVAKRTAKRFVDDFLQPGDLAAIVHTQGTFVDSQPFTSSKQLLDASIDRYGRGLSGDLDVRPRERVQRHMDSYRTIQDVATRLGSISGRRKAILWVGAQLRFEMPTCANQGAIKTPGDDERAETDCETFLRWNEILVAHREAMAAATRNNVAIYAIDPAGLQNVNVTVSGDLEPRPVSSKDDLDRLAALRIVAEDTGGLSVVNTNNFEGGFKNIVSDNSTYYVLGYAPSTEYLDGKFHEVKVRVKRPGVYTVRQRRGYTAPAAPDSSVAETTAPPRGASTATRDALRLPVPVRGLSISIFNAAFRGDAHDDSVVIGGQITGDLLLEGNQQISLAYQVFTLDNHVQAGEYKTLGLNLTADSRANATVHGLHFVDRLSLPPGRYELRYVVDQPNSHLGSVVAPLIVPAFDDTLSLSGVVLASVATADHFMLRDDAGIRERLGANPTSSRTFHRGDTLNAFAEVYADDVHLTADDLSITASLVTADGKSVVKEDARLRSAERPGDGRWAYSVEVGLADVPAGSYTLSVEATSTRHKEAVRRLIPITIAE
jgi:VWFA-related protein